MLPPAPTAPPAWTLLFETKPRQERERTHTKGATAGSASPTKHSSCGDPLLKTAKQTSPPSLGFTSESLVHSWKLQKSYGMEKLLPYSGLCHMRASGAGKARIYPQPKTSTCKGPGAPRGPVCFKRSIDRNRSGCPSTRINSMLQNSQSAFPIQFHKDSMPFTQIQGIAL